MKKWLEAVLALNRIQYKSERRNIINKSLGIVFALVIAVLLVAVAVVPAVAIIKPPPQEAGGKVLYSGEPDVAIPTLINYQGYLTDSGGNPIDDTVSITFTIYDAATDGSVVWTETQPAVTVNDGLFNVLLGSVSPINASHLTGTRYLGVKVGADPEMTPRQQIVSVAYALRSDEANNANTLDGMDSNAFLAVAGDTMAGELNMGNNAITNIDWAASDDGTGSGLDADTLDGQQGSYYQNASNINTGTLSTNRYSAYSDLSAEGKIGNGAGQVAAGDHTHTNYVSKTGDTMTGTLNLPGNGLVAGTNQLVLSGGNVGVGNTAPIYKLEVDGNARITKGGLSTDSFLQMNDIVYNSIPSDLWIGQLNWALRSCDSSGRCIYHGDKGDHIISMTVYNGKLWIGQAGGDLQSCDSSGSCINHGNKGAQINAMAVYGGSLWLGQGDGYLKFCDSSGSCTNFFDTGVAIISMSVYDGKLWIGQGDGVLQSYSPSGGCTNHGDKGANINAMAVYNGKLWIGQGDGVLQSCDPSGACTNHGDKGTAIYSMAVYNGGLWIGQAGGDLQSCYSSGSCTNRGDKGANINAMAVYNGKLWIGQGDGVLQSCDSSGSCTNHGDKGDAILAMAVYHPSSLGGAIYVKSGNVGINTTNPGTKLAVDGLPSTSSYSLVRINTSTGDFYIDGSSQRYKEDIEDFAGDFYKILDAEPKSYVDKTSGQREIGYIAEDFDELGLIDLVIYNGEGEPDGLKYDRISLYLVEIIEAQQAQIEELLERVEALEQANQ